MKITKDDLKELLTKYPLLHVWGYETKNRKSDALINESIEELQDKLINEIRAINLVIEFLGKHATKTRVITKDSSYYYKHLVEKHTGEYISNGVFIAGALLAGYRMKPDPGFNPCFNMVVKNA